MSRPREWLGRARARLMKALGATLVALMAAMTLDVLWQVFTRYLLGRPSSVTEELARYLLIWVGLLGACYAYGGRLHVALGVPWNRWLPAHSALGRWLRRAPALLVIVFAAAVLVVGGTSLVLLTLQLGQTSAALGLPLGLVYLVLPLSGAIVCFLALCDLASMPGGER